jgi:hypothetical protein
MAFIRDYQDSRPTEWHKQDAFRKARQPLGDAANQAFAFFRSLRECEASATNVWKDARVRLREDPNAAVLRELVREFDMLADPDDQRPTS